MSQLKLFLIGGFLGSGKTTAIIEAVKYIHQHQKKVVVITNDQGTQQVDTLFIRGHDIPSEEVSGGCFCCNYEKLEKRIDYLNLTNNPDIIFAESVGSCTDLAATVINPLLSIHPGQYEIILSVFADIRLLMKFLQNDKDIFFDNVNYIYEKQLEEADIIVVNKIDLLNEDQLALAKKLINKEYGGKIICYQNSLSKDSISRWVQLMIGNFHNTSLRSTPEIDYNIYGTGEAELAWLDEELCIVTKDKKAVAAGYLLINKVYDKITKHHLPIGHLKFLLNNGKQQRKISFNSLGVSRGNNDPDFAETDRIIILINARVQGTPTLLQKIIAEAIIETELSTPCKIIENNISAFKPGYPKPTHRIPA